MANDDDADDEIVIKMPIVGTDEECSSEEEDGNNDEDGSESDEGDEAVTENVEVEWKSFFSCGLPSLVVRAEKRTPGWTQQIVFRNQCLYFKWIPLNIWMSPP